ncbi:MAG: AAA family ATPase [Polyangiaceae bacterium]
MKPPFIESLRLDGFLSFPPESQSIDLRGLNVLIGPNGSGKSNFLEALSLLATLGDSEHFHSRLRIGGGVEQWIWKGGRHDKASIHAKLYDAERNRKFGYDFSFAASPQGPVVLEESFADFEDGGPAPREIYFRVSGDKFVVATKFIGPDGIDPNYTTGVVDRQYVRADASLMSQRNARESYPDTFWLADRLSRIYEFRDWSVGLASGARPPQTTASPTDRLLFDASNLAMLVQDMDHRGALSAFEPYLRRFLPRFERLSTRVSGGTIQLYLHERGIIAPIPAPRLSEGTLRFIALLAVLLDPNPHPLVSIEEPELGLHPDALALVAELLVDASERTQLVVTTHADTLVSELSEQAESVLICENLGDGTVISRLENQKLAHWLDRYRLGDVWRMGELGGNP